MKNFAKLTAVALAFSAIASANASVINLQTGFSGAGPQATAEAYRAVVDAAVATPGAGYGSTVLASYDNMSNHALFGSSTNIAFKSTINFGVQAGETGNWSFRAGVDFGGGGAVFLDGHAVDFRNTDMWWAGNYGNSSQFFQFAANIGAGNHTITMYGLEGCCDGAQQFQFNSGSGFHSFDNQTLNPVPEPETYAMLLAGLGLLGVMSHRKLKAKAA
ncbi:MAG: CCXG family PEP-CTERM protein [Burkholderiales bacterium]|nr:CCXG family PEP-CTERM protein [Burkholderiales bacterium]